MANARLRLIDLALVRERTGLSGPSVYRLASKGLFPKPVKVGQRASRWVEDEIDAFIRERIASRLTGGGR